MKKTYHICLSGGDEVMYRDEEDYIRGINCLCLAAHKTDSTLLAYSFMSNHAHIGVRTEYPDQFIKSFRYPYNRYFNSKYKRNGILGERDYFILEIEGLYHLLTAIAYILRNPLHHGVSATPFGYRYSSIGALFQKDMGHFVTPELLPRKSQYRFLPEEATQPAGFKMDKSGLILPESVIDVADIEHQFSTARSFLYYMNRLTSDAWKTEQLQDETNIPPITLETIESAVGIRDMKTLLNNEYGRQNYYAKSDITLCKEIDSRLSGETIYTLTECQIRNLANHILREERIPYEQLKRCLGGRI